MKLEGMRSSEGGENAIDRGRAEAIAEQREERLARRRERDRASRQLHTTKARHTRLDQDRVGHQRRRA